MTAILRRWLGDNRVSFIAFAIASAAIPTLYLSFFPSMGGVKSDLLKQMPEAFTKIFNVDDIGTGAGWAHMTAYSLIGLFVMMGAAVMWGSRAIAGHEEDGTLELTLAHGVTRRQVLWGRALAIIVQLTVLNLIVALVVLALNGPMGLKLDFGHLAAEHAAYLALVVLHALLALAVGAMTGRRGLAIGASAGIFFLGYILTSVANYLPKYDWTRVASTFDWAYRWKPLMNGWDLLGIGVLAGLAVVAMLVAQAVLDRRDIGA